jgi:ribosome-associated protein
LRNGICHVEKLRLNKTGKETYTIVRYKSAPPSSKNLLDAVKASLDDDKALDVDVIDLAGKTDFADAMIIASGTSGRHVATMAEHLRENLKGAGLASVAIEGLNQCDWVLIDAGDVIVHIFRPEVRQFYELEKIWRDPTPRTGSTART